MPAVDDWGVKHVVGWPERRIGAVAARQRSLITFSQLTDLGAGRGAVRHARDTGRLHALHHGVYALVPPEALPPLAREHAAVLACGTDALLSHHSAAAVWGLMSAPAGDVEVTVIGRDAGRRRAGIRAHRTPELHRHDRRTYRQIPIVAPARTLLDIAPALSERQLERAVDEALVRQVMTLDDVRAAVARAENRSGARRIADLADPDRPTTATRSPSEDVMLALVRRARLPAPEVNVRIGRYSADFLWRAERVIVEVDSYTYHRGRFPFERDHERDAEHIQSGFVVLRVTKRQLEREPEAFLVRLATALARRAAA